MTTGGSRRQEITTACAPVRLPAWVTAAAWCEDILHVAKAVLEDSMAADSAGAVSMEGAAAMVAVDGADSQMNF
jgi:hypothetical protein